MPRTVRPLVLLACAGFLASAALLPTGARLPGPAAEATGVFSDPALPGLTVWLETALENGSLAVHAVAHGDGRHDYAVRHWGRGEGSWTDSILDAAGNDTYLPGHLLLTVQPAHVSPMGAWFNQSEQWDGKQWRALDAAQLNHGWVSTPGAYTWRFHFDAYTGPVAWQPPATRPGTRPSVGLPVEVAPSASFPDGVPQDDAAWRSIAIDLPVTVDAAGAVHAGTPVRTA